MFSLAEFFSLRVMKKYALSCMLRRRRVSLCSQFCDSFHRPTTKVNFGGSLTLMVNIALKHHEKNRSFTHLVLAL
jgi:hypothetical protein